MMDYKVVTPAGAEPILLAEAKLHLRVDNIGNSHPDDSLITDLIIAARGLAEQHTGRAIAADQGFKGVLDQFPNTDEIWLPMPPVNTLTSIKYTNSAGGESTMDPGDYTFDDYGLRNRIFLNYGKIWPTTLSQRNAVRIEWVAGMVATDPEFKQARQGMLLAIGAWYKNKEKIITGTIAIELPGSAMNVLDSIKLWGRTC